MKISKVKVKGQITIPKEIMDILGLNPEIKYILNHLKMEL